MGPSCCSSTSPSRALLPGWPSAWWRWSAGCATLSNCRSWLRSRISLTRGRYLTRCSPSIAAWSHPPRPRSNARTSELSVASRLFFAVVLFHRNPLAVHFAFRFDLRSVGRLLGDGGASLHLLPHHRSILVPHPGSTLWSVRSSVHIAAGAIDAEFDELFIRRVVGPVDGAFHLRRGLRLPHLPLSDHPVSAQVLLDDHGARPGLLAAHLGRQMHLARALPGAHHAVHLRQLRGRFHRRFGR